MSVFVSMPSGASVRFDAQLWYVVISFLGPSRGLTSPRPQVVISSLGPFRGHTSPRPQEKPASPAFFVLSVHAIAKWTVLWACPVVPHAYTER